MTGWLISHAAAVSVIGAALLIGLGLASLRSFVAAPRSGTPDPDKASASGALVAMSRRTAFATTFVLTAANPATIVSFVSFVGVVAALGAAKASASAAFLLVLGAAKPCGARVVVLTAACRAGARRCPAPTIG